MKVQLEFDLTDRGSRAALMTMLTAIDSLEDAKPERRRDSGDKLQVGSAVAGEVVVSGDIDAENNPAPSQVNGGEPARHQDRGDEHEERGPIARARGRTRKAAAAEAPPAPPTAPPINGTTDVSGPDEETVPPHSILGEPVSIDTIEKDGVGRSKITGKKHELSVVEARKLAIEHLQTVFRSGDPKVKSEVAAYQRELGLRAFSDCPDERAYDMYRRSIEMMHAIGKSA